MRWLTSVGLLIFSFCALAQEKCATNFIQANQYQRSHTEAFESWLKQKKRINQQIFFDGQHRLSIYQIPVVFHVIHDGSAIGEGSNLADEKLIEQLTVINQDFRRNNPDASETPSEFLDVATDSEIEFVMAKQDPEGLPTSGIVRKRGSKSVYSPNDDRTLKAESAWPQEDYLNIYITNLSGGNLGYAQFPFSNIDGIASELENYRSTDGVVLDYEWVGFNNNTSGFDSKGRTATHEIGHYLGLRHIWGDGGCGVDDFCDDTPLAATSTSGCPSNKVTCDTKDMIQNYMDYTNDACMNLFTECQKSRMRTVLQESPRRKSLLTSKGLEEPIIWAVDAGIKSIISPEIAGCNELINPQVEIRNRGTEEITSMAVDLIVNGEQVETINFEGNLDPLETASITFSPVAVDPSLMQEFTFEIRSVNGQQDEDPQNDASTIVLTPFENKILPVSIDFEESVGLFESNEEAESSYWTIAPAPLGEAGNQALMAPYFQQEANFGLQDRMVTNTLDLSTLSSAQLEFKYAYSPTPQNHLDGFIVAVSKDCGQTYPVKDYLYERYGSGLGTTAASAASFIPSGSEDWEEVNINLTQYAGLDEIQIAFIGVNGGGNNLFLDDIQITSANLLGYDLGVKSIENIPAVACDTDVLPIIEVKNFGFETIDALSLQVFVNGIPSNHTFTNLSLASGLDVDFLLNVTDRMNVGENEILVEITEVDGRTDEYPTNNSKQVYIEVNADEATVPVRENFDTFEWTVHSPEDANLFELTKINGNRVLQAAGFSNSEISQSYLVTPVLSTSTYNELALEFDYSYAQRIGFNDNFKVLISVNCGKTYEEALLSLHSEELANGLIAEDSWVPASEDDWQSKFINLTNYLAWPEIRLAFVFTNGNGNNFYLDNVEVLTNSDPDLPTFSAQVTTYPNPASGIFYVGLNLQEKQKLLFRLVDMTGRVVFEEEKDNLLNQTLTFFAPNQRGFYILQVLGNGVNQTKRIYLSP